MVGRRSITQSFNLCPGAILLVVVLVLDCSDFRAVHCGSRVVRRRAGKFTARKSASPPIRATRVDDSMYDRLPACLRLPDATLRRPHLLRYRQNFAEAGPDRPGDRLEAYRTWVHSAKKAPLNPSTGCSVPRVETWLKPIWKSRKERDRCSPQTSWLHGSRE
jgi:hypothetical protein